MVDKESKTTRIYNQLYWGSRVRDKKRRLELFLFPATVILLSSGIIFGYNGALVGGIIFFIIAPYAFYDLYRRNKEFKQTHPRIEKVTITKRPKTDFASKLIRTLKFSILFTLFLAMNIGFLELIEYGYKSAIKIVLYICVYMFPFLFGLYMLFLYKSESK